MTGLTTMTTEVDVSGFKSHFKSMLPKSRQKHWKEEEVDYILESLQPEEHLESFLSSMNLAIRAIDKDYCRASIREYSNAVRYVNLVNAKNTQREAYLTVFPDKKGHWDIANPNAPTKKTQSNSVQQYNNSVIVRDVAKELDLCMSAIYRASRINVLDTLLKMVSDTKKDDKGRDFVSPKNKIEAAKVFLDNVKPPEDPNKNAVAVEINLGQPTLNDFSELLAVKSKNIVDMGIDAVLDDINTPLDIGKKNEQSD